ncbi:MAG: flavodoxin [Oscillospiraceae bacterium]|nr:flavodoxin [Oscillospiraceae bacterium]
MSKIAVVYWSGTGNTQSMAEAVAQGVKDKGAEAVLLTPDTFDPSMIDSMDAIAFGCPAMGTEVLEESEFEPMFSSCESKLSGKKIALFGSYGWGDGEWMRNWEAACKKDEAVFACGSVICNEAPDDNGIASCKALGAALAE